MPVIMDRFAEIQLTSYCLILFALLFPTQGSLATVSGEILDREGKPMVGALITYTQIGMFDRNYKMGGAVRSESPRMVEGTGRICKIKTDKKGAFVMIGMDYGVTKLKSQVRMAAMFIPERKRLSATMNPAPKIF